MQLWQFYGSDIVMNAVTTSFAFICRSCFASGYLGAEKAPQSCLSCGGDIRVDDEIFNLTIAHIDCDSFYASIEKRDNPDLLDKPVIVGGERRGVVAAACYVARQHGIRSAMPSFKAKQLCPDVTIIKPRMDHYVSVSRQIREMMISLTPQIEPLSIDEAFLDLSGTHLLHKASPAEMLMRLQQKIKQDIGITVSVGLAANKSLAKLASDQGKPDGFFILNQDKAAAWLADKPVSIIYGIGKKAAQKLTDAGLPLCRDLAQAELGHLAQLLGKNAAFIQNLSKGIDTREVKVERQAKSISSETTFNKDISLESELKPIIERQAMRVSRRLKEKGLKGRVITLKAKTAHHKIITRSKTLSAPTDKAYEIFDVATALMAGLIGEGHYWRLLGVGVDGFDHDNTAPSHTDFFSLLEPAAKKPLEKDKVKSRDAIEKALDDMHAKFGADMVFSGKQTDRLTKKPK